MVDQLRGVVNSSRSSEQERREAIVTLSGSKSDAATIALEWAFSHVDSALTATVAYALLERNKIIPLDFAVETLLHGYDAASHDTIHNLEYSIAEGVRDERAIPALGQLLNSSHAEVRRAAASALRHIGSWSAVPALSPVLWDSDRESRYYAVIGLAEITKQDEWRPLMDAFASNEGYYLAHWRDWARTYK